MSKPYSVNIVTLFPDMFPGPLGLSIMGRAHIQNIWALSTTQIRDFATDKHKTVDDTPYGGGAGMLMRADVVAGAIRAAKEKEPEAKVVYLSPAGKKFDQVKARDLSTAKGLILVCGHYEGIDQRVLDREVDEELSIGDYVLTGGEMAAMIMVDAVVRNLPDVLGNTSTLHEESFDIQTEEGTPLVEYPHYTRPAVWEGESVPEVLMSGHHGRIEAWRKEQALKRTQERRPDLLVTKK